MRNPFCQTRNRVLLQQSPVKRTLYLGPLALALAHWAGTVTAAASPAPPRLPQEAYVWQRAWNEPVRGAVRAHAGSFSNLVALAAEVSWQAGQPQVVRVPLDFALLRSLPCPVGLALRVGPYAGPFAADDPAAQRLASVATSLTSQAATHQLPLSELQLDFDCAASKLAGYRVWVEALRRRVAPLPLRITALPAWLKRPEFAALARATDGYVLQVHSLARPKNFAAPFTLCDPVAARQAVTQAGQLGVPFRVALPTYGYRVAFASNGQFVGLSAEGPAQNWPADAKLREVRAEAQVLAELVQGWATHRPTALRGLIWYRLPVPGDTLNWRWPTLAALLETRSPRESLRTATRRIEAGLIEVTLANDGELDLSSRLVVAARWRAARLVAGDALRSFELIGAGAAAVRFQTASAPCRLAPGERQVIGWLRFDREVEVQVGILKE